VKWFLTGDSIGLAALLEAAGETVVSPPSHYRDRIDELEEATDYRLDLLLRKAREVDVLVLDGMYEPPGYAKRHVVPWGGAVRGRCVVGVETNDPEAFDAATKYWRGCVCRTAQISVYVTNDSATANRASASRRAVLWEGDAAPVIKAALHQCAYKPISGVGRIYTTTGQHTSI